MSPERLAVTAEPWKESIVLNASSPLNAVEVNWYVSALTVVVTEK
jgi:hypothetical protein